MIPADMCHYCGFYDEVQFDIYQNCNTCVQITTVTQFLNQISKPLKEAKLIPLTHKYMTVYFPWYRYFSKNALSYCSICKYRALVASKFICYLIEITTNV